jgi:phosphoribosylanthranilate isomerase
MCGMTRPEDARAAAAAGTSAIGLVFWPASPRVVDIPTARAIVAALPAGVPAIGVFVNQPVDEINEIVRQAGLFGVQLHGDEPADVIPQIKRPVIRAITRESRDLAGVLPSHVTVLFDSHDPVRRGGTGSVADWAIAREIAAARPVVLAGGLTPGNVGQAIAAVRPYAVDVSSGIESAPGIKDDSLIAAFMEAVKQARPAAEVTWP